MYQELSELFAGVIILMAMFMAAGWKVSLARIVELRKSSDAAQQAAIQANDAATELGALALLHERRASEFFKIIEGVEGERDGWMKLYRESAHQAGVAQAWLVRDMTRVIQIGNRYAQRLRERGEKAPPVDVDPQLKPVVEDFAETHAQGHPEIQSTDAKALARAVDNPVPGQKVD